MEEEVYDQVNEDAKIYDHIVTKGVVREQVGKKTKVFYFVMIL